MNKIRIHKDITIRWRIKTNGEAAPLEGRDLVLFLTDCFGNKNVLPFAVTDTNLITACFLGKEQTKLGNYILTLAENVCKDGSTAVDEVEAFTLVSRTSEESKDNTSNLEVATIDLEGDIFVGGRGMSTYEIWLAQGNVGTEAEFLEAMRGPVGPQGEQGIPGVEGPVGPEGKPGKDGVDGRSIREIKQVRTSTTSGGENVIRVYLSDGTYADFYVRNGQKGEDSGIKDIKSVNNTSLIKNGVATIPTIMIKELGTDNFDDIIDEQTSGFYRFTEDGNIKKLVLNLVNTVAQSSDRDKVIISFQEDNADSLVFSFFHYDSRSGRWEAVKEYGLSEIADKVSKYGDETIKGTKTFESSPVVPKPRYTMNAANKGYVDEVVDDVTHGDGSILVDIPDTGDAIRKYAESYDNGDKIAVRLEGDTGYATMEVERDPSREMEVATKRYVDNHSANVDIYDNLTTEDPNAALSAKQGVVLDRKKLDKPTQYLDDSLISPNIARSSKVSEVDGKVSGLSSQVTNLATTKQDVIPDLDTIRQGAANGATAEQIREAMAALPDGSAVSAQVAVNTAKVAELDRIVSGLYDIEYSPSLEVVSIIEHLTTTTNVQIETAEIGQPIILAVRTYRQVLKGDISQLGVLNVSGLHAAYASPFYKVVITDESGIVLYSEKGTSRNDTTPVTIDFRMLSSAKWVYISCASSSGVVASVSADGVIGQLSEKVDAISVNILDEIEPITPSLEGYYAISNKGVKLDFSSNQAYGLTNPISLEKGQVIRATFGVGANVSAFTKSNGDGTYKPLIGEITSLVASEHEYTASEDCDVVISYYFRNGLANVTIIDQSKFNLLRTDVDNLTGKTDRLEADINEVKNGQNDYLKYAVCRPLFIGDSLTEGALPTSSWGDKGVAVMKENFPYMMGRMLDTSVKNEGHSGYSASNWWLDYSSNTGSYVDIHDSRVMPCRITQKPEFDKYDSIFIWLGTNYGYTDTLETDVNPYADYNDFANTETGYLCRIIAKIKEATHGESLIVLSKIFVTKSDGYDTTTSNIVIDKIAQKYGCLVVDNSDLSYGNHPELHMNINNPHFGKAGNLFVAQRYIKELYTYFSVDVLRCEFGIS